MVWNCETLHALKFHDREKVFFFFSPFFLGSKTVKKQLLLFSKKYVFFGFFSLSYTNFIFTTLQTFPITLTLEPDQYHEYFIAITAPSPNKHSM